MAYNMWMKKRIKKQIKLLSDIGGKVVFDIFICESPKSH